MQAHNYACDYLIYCINKMLEEEELNDTHKRTFTKLPNSSIGEAILTDLILVGFKPVKYLSLHRPNMIFESHIYAKIGRKLFDRFNPQNSVRIGTELNEICWIFFAKCAPNESPLLHGWRVFKHGQKFYIDNSGLYHIYHPHTIIHNRISLIYCDNICNTINVKKRKKHRAHYIKTILN